MWLNTKKDQIKIMEKGFLSLFFSCLIQPHGLDTYKYLKKTSTDYVSDHTNQSELLSQVYPISFIQVSLVLRLSFGDIIHNGPHMSN